MLIWSFLLRGISLEVGGHLDDKLWQSAWNFVFAVSSLLLAVLLGAALGNMIRGVPLDHSGKFSMSLFTHFGVRGRVGILDWYTISVAVFTTAILAAHGATYLRLKTSGRVHERSDALARRLWAAILVLFPLVTYETWIVRPDLYRAAAGRPFAWIATLAVVAGAWAIWIGLRRSAESVAFAGSCAVIAGLLVGATASAFPVMLHSTIAPEYSITAYSGATAERGLTIALFWWPIALCLSLTYAITVYRSYGGKVA